MKSESPKEMNNELHPMNTQTETKAADINIDKSKIPLIRSLGLTTAILMVAGTIIG